MKTSLNELGLNDLSSFSKLRIPFIFEINLREKEYFIDEVKLKNIIEFIKFLRFNDVAILRSISGNLSFASH